MARHFRPDALLPILLAILLSSLTGTPAQAQGYQLVWSDEFDGTSVDTGKWTLQTGTGCPSLCGWGNNELQYYRTQNAVVSGGVLTITAKEESFAGSDYTSARLNTAGKFDATYGRIEMRAKLPIGQGLWPAFWMMPAADVYGGWAASGEIDIMEYVGQDPDRVFGTLHFGGSWPDNTSAQSGPGYILDSGTFNDDFHVFALEWEPGTMRWYVDDTLFSVQHDWYSTGGLYPAPFDQDFYILLNLAVGGNLPGDPDGTTVFPQEYVIDYVRVYQKPEFEGCRIVFADLDHADPFNNGWFSFGGSVGGGGIGANTTSVPPNVGQLASLDSGWGSGGTPGFFGGFGRRNPRDLTGMTHFSFWIDPDPGQDYTLVVQFQDDDNGDDSIPSPPDGADDEFQTEVVVNSSGGDVDADGGWQKVSIPLADLVDDNSYHWGGNGVFDPYATANGGNGQLVNIVVSVVSNSGANVTFRTDRWEFTREEGGAEGVVWWDDNHDGVLDAGEGGVSGVTVNLFDEFDDPVDSSVTDGSGAYAFETLPSGPYRIAVDATGVLDGSTPTADPDGVGTAHEAWTSVDCAAVSGDLNFGYQSSQIGVPDGLVGPGPVLSAAFPNPFAVSTRVEFSLDRSGPALVTVYDLTGRKVCDLVQGELAEGRHNVVWQGRDAAGREVADGVYLLVLRTEDEAETRRVLRLR